MGADMKRFLMGTALVALTVPALAQDAAYMPVSIDATKGRVLLTVPALDTDIL